MEYTTGGDQRKSGDLLTPVAEQQKVFVSDKKSSQEKLCPRDTLVDARNTTCVQIDAKGVKALTHKEMLEAVELGKLTSGLYEREMKRRKEAREQRRTLKKKQEFVMKQGRQEVIVSLPVQIDESGEEMIELPLTAADFDLMDAYFSKDKPFWKNKMSMYRKLHDVPELEKRLNASVHSLYKKGTVAYFADLVWGSRRLRDKFMDAMEEGLAIAKVQCAEPELEEIRKNPDLNLIFDEQELEELWDEESVSWGSDSDSDSDFFGFDIEVIPHDDEPIRVAFEFQSDALAWDYYDLTNFVEDYEWEVIGYHRCPELGPFTPTFMSLWDEEDSDEESDEDYEYSPSGWIYEEEWPHVQSDETVLESEASVAGHGNMTFVEERPTDTDSSHIAPSISAKDTLQTMAENDWMTIKSILEREIIVYRGSWDETQNGQIHSIPIPKCFVTGPDNFVKRQLSVAAFLRAGVEFRIQTNGNKFAMGRLIFALLPPMFEEDVENYITVQCFNWPHVKMDASVSNVGTLFVPFTHILTHFPQRAGSLESDSIATLGRLVIYCVNPLKVGDGASNVLNYTVYARFVNPEIHQTAWPIEKFSYSDGIITQAGGEGEGLFKKILGGGLSTALGAFLSKMTGGLATGLGSMLTGLIFDYPRDPMPGEPVLNQSVGPLSYGAGVDHSFRLALTPVSQQEMTSSIIGSTNGDFNIKTLLQIPSLLMTVDWTASMVPGTELFSIPISPVYLPNSRINITSDNSVIYVPTMQAYICRGFCYWNGTWIVKITVIKTQYNCGRVMFVYVPFENAALTPTTTPADALEYYNQGNAVVVDIEEQQEFEIKIPFMSVRPWLRCDSIRTPYDFYNPKGIDPNNPRFQHSYLGESFCGFLKAFVLNRVVSPSNVPQDVQMNVFVAAGKDFELAYPAPLTPLNVRSYGQGAFGGYQEYPFIISKDPVPISEQSNFENQFWIKALYHDGERLFYAGKLSVPKGRKWYQAVTTLYVGSVDDEAVTWVYKAGLMEKYFNSVGETGIQVRFMSSLPNWTMAKVQAIEEYTTTRQNGLMSISATNGDQSCEVAPATVSENAMNLQTVMRRFYCLYNSVPIYSQTAYVVVTVPVNPSFVPIVRYPVKSGEKRGYGEPIPIDHVAWFVKLYTYWFGSNRYKITTDNDAYDVEVVHSPTECYPFGIRTGVKEIDVQKLMAYASAAMVTQVQGSLDVEVPYASAYPQLFVDVHGKYFDSRCQNGTLFIFFRRKQSVNPGVTVPLTFTIYRTIGDDFGLNLLRAPPLVEEPQMLFGNCEEGSTPVNISVPEAARGQGYNSRKIALPGGTGFNKLDKMGYFGDCRPRDQPSGTEEELPKVQCEEYFPRAETLDETWDRLRAEIFEPYLEDLSLIELPKAQMFEQFGQAFGELKKTHNLIQDTALKINTAVTESKLTETLQSLNSVSSKIDSFVSKTESTASSLSSMEDVVKKYSLIAAEVVLCGTFVHQIKTVLQEPSMPNLLTLGIEFGLIVGLTTSETLQSLLMRVVDWAMNIHVLKPEQPRAQALDGAMDFVDDNSGVICSVVAVLGTVLYAYMFGALPSFDKIKEVIKSFFEGEEESPAKVQSIEKALGFSLKGAHFSLLGLGALEKVYNKIVEWVQRLLYWFLDKENPEVVMARSAADVRDRVLDLIKELDELDYEPNFIAALEDPLVHNRFYRMKDEVNDLTAACTNSKIDQRVVMLLTECRRRATDLIKRLEEEGGAASTLRYDPYVICLHGPTGTGKTRVAEKFFDLIAEIMGLPKHHRVHSKNIRDAYWSGYTRHPIVFWDEFGQSKEADKDAIPEFMALRGDKPVKVNMASLADKGRNFTSQAIVMTTNVPYQTYNTIRDNGAMMRRRHVMIRMRHKEGFNVDMLQHAAYNAYPNWEHCDFAITYADNPGVKRDNMTLNDVLEYVREDLTTYHQNQIYKLAEEQVPVLPRGVIPNPGLVNQDFDPELQLLIERDQAAMDRAIAEDRAVLEQEIGPENLPAVGGAAAAEPEEDEDEFSLASESLSVTSSQIEENVNLMEDLLNGAEVQGFEFDSDSDSDSDDDEDALFQLDEHAKLNEVEKFTANMFLSRMSRASRRKTLQAYLLAKERTKMKISRIYKTACNFFSKAVKMITDFWQNNPKVCKILGILTLLGGVGAIMHFRSKEEVEHYESGPTRGSARRVYPELYESGPARAPRHRALPEGSDDQQATEIATKIGDKVYPMEWVEGSTRKAKLNGFHIGGHIMLVPFHFFNHAKEGEFFDVKHRKHPVRIEFKFENMYHVEEKDWVLYNCGVRLEAGARLWKFFIDEKHLGLVKKSRCMLITHDRASGMVCRDSGMIEPRQRFGYQDDNWGDTYVQTGWRHDLNTAVGHCGGPLIICSNRLPSPGKIAGIHVAGFCDKSEGFGVLITTQMLEEGMRHFGVIPGPAVIPQCVERGLVKGIRLLPDGDFSIVGKMPNSMAPAQPVRTTFEETPFQELAIAELGPVPKIPAKLRPFEKEDGTIVSPLKNGIVKYGYFTYPFPGRNIKKVEMYFIHMFDRKLNQHTGRRIFSIPEAVNGLPGVDFAEKMNMKSSAGWPYQMENRAPGKWHLFDHEGNIVDPSVTARLEERRTAAQKYERVPSIWRDCMKDELRPVAKVMAGKTRLFTIAPVDFTILVRQMFLDFVMAFYSAYGDDFFSAVGINPESPDWTNLYSYLAEFNTEVVAGDYECFDGKEMPEIMMSVCNIINAWYGDDMEHQLTRETLFLEMIHTVQLCENLVYMTHQGNPSGNPLTTVINTIVNVYLLVLAWLELQPDKTVDDFFQNVRVKAYGDDNLIAVKPRYTDKFNQNTIAEALLRHNIVYTSESKTGEQVPDTRPLLEVSFLKRGFRKDPEFGSLFMLPTMSVETLNAYFYYYRRAPDAESQIQENQRSALLFAAFHGRAFYEEYLARWKRFMKHADMSSLQISFEEQVDSFLWAAGMLDQKPKCVRKSEILIEGMEAFMKVTNSKPVRSVLGALEAPFYYFAACLGICASEPEEEPTDDRWAIAIPSGEGKSTLCKLYPWLFVDHDDLLLPYFEEQKRLPWSAKIARELDFPPEDRRILLVHHASNTKRRLVGSFVTPYPTFIRINCIQRLRMKDPIKMDRNDRNLLLVQLATALEPTLKRSDKLGAYHPPACLNRLSAGLHDAV